MKKNKGLVFFASIFFSVNLWAQDISGTWQQIDDKTGSPKSIIEIRKEANNKLTKTTKHAKRHFWLNDVCTCHGLLPSHSA